MDIIEKRVSSGDGKIFDFDEFMSRPLFAHLAHCCPDGPRESPVWFHWDGEAMWIIGGTTFPTNLKHEPRCALGIVDWNPATGLLHHVGMRGRAEVVPLDLQRVRTIFLRYFGPDEKAWDRRFNDVITGEAGIEMIRVRPDTVVMRDQSYAVGR